MRRKDPIIEKVNGIMFDVELDNGKNAIIKFKVKDGFLLPDMAELSFTANYDEHIARVSFNYSAFEIEIDYLADVQFDISTFREMLGCGTGTEQ